MCAFLPLLSYQFSDSPDTKWLSVQVSSGTDCPELVHSLQVSDSVQ